MAACQCIACGGRVAWLAEQEAKMNEKRAAFEAWLADPQNAETIARIKAEVEAEKKQQEVRA